MLIKTCKERQKKWVRHILRHDGLLKDVIEGWLEGKRPRGRKQIMILDSIKGREPYQRMKERAQDRQRWSDYQIWNLLNSSTLQRENGIYKLWELYRSPPLARNKQSVLIVSFTGSTQCLLDWKLEQKKSKSSKSCLVGPIYNCHIDPVTATQTA